MVNAWPSDVPTSAAAGTLNEEIEDTRAKFVPDAGGPPLLRQRQTVADTVITYDTIPVPTSVWTSLWNFYLANQAAVFTRVHPDPDAAGTLNWQFEAPPKRKDANLPGYHIISVSIRLRP